MIVSSAFNKINWILFFSLAALLLLPTMASAEFIADTGIAGNNKEKVTIQLKWFHQFQFAGYYAAIEKGFYAKEGLQVELRQRVAGTSHIKDVLQDRAQYGIADAGLLLSRLQGKPVVLLAQIFQHSPLIFLTREDSGIRTAEDLAGKRIMFDVKVAGDMPLLALMFKVFGGFDATNIQPQSFNLNDLIDGKVDAFSAYITSQPYRFHERGVAVNIINPRDYGIDFYGDNLFTTEQELREHPQRVEKIRRATLKGWRYALNNRKEIINLILQKYNSQDLSRESLEYEARETEKLVVRELLEIGSLDAIRYQKIAKIYAETGFVEQTKLDPEFFYQQKKQFAEPDIPAPRFRLIFITLTVLSILAVLMFKVSRKTNFESQFGMKRFRYGLLAVLLLFMIIVSIVAWWVLEYNKQQLLKNRQLQLETVLNTTSERLNIWIEQHKIYLQQLAKNPELVSLTENLLKVSPKPETLQSSSALVRARRFFSDNRNTFGEKGFFIISPERISLGSMRDTNLGIRNLIAKHKPELLDRVFQGEVLFIPPIQSDVPLSIGKNTASITTTMFFAAPIRNRNGKVIAVLTQRLDPLTDFSQVIHFGQIGETGETYAFSKQGRLLSESHFNKQLRSIGLIGANQHSSLSIDIRDPGGNLQTGYKPEIEHSEQALTRMAASAVRGESGVDMTGYRDYRGVSVLGAWLWDHSLSIGLATEIDVDEAMTPYRLMRGSVLGVLTLTLLLSSAAIFFTLFTGERVSRNLRQINRQLQLEINERESTQRKLKDRETRFSAIFRNVVDGIITINTEGLIESFNPAAESIFGYNANDVIGKSANILIAKDHQSKHDDYLKHYIQTDEAHIIGFGRELEAKRSDGSVFPMEISVSEMWIGEERKFTGVVRDITERNLAHEELRQYQEHLEELVQQRTSELSATNVKLETERDRIQRYMNLAEAIIVTLNTEGHIIMINRKGCEILGYTQDELIGKNWFETCLTQPDGLEEVYSVFEKIIAGDLKTVEYYENEIVTRSGERRLIAWHNNCLVDENGQIEGTISAGEDITERKLADEELKQAKEQAESASRSKSDFLANMSHELRTPLNVILGYAHILQNDPSIISTQRERIETIERSGKHLLEQISDILDVAKIEANKIELFPAAVNINFHIKYICNYFNLRAEMKGIDLTCSIAENINPLIRVDERRLQQILLNLISNAINYTEKGKVIVKVEPAKPATEITGSESGLRFSVEDTGIGIPKENLEQIFKPFVQLQQKNHNNEGTGLGLNIASQLVKIMGGKLNVESKVKKGSRFWFDLILPVAKQSNELNLQKRETPTGYSGRKRKILAVDDIKDNREVIRDMLTSLGFQAVVASKGLDSVIIAKDMQPDLIIMDLLMPELNGYESLTTLRNMPECKSIPVVAMSANVSEEKSAILAGFDHFLPKPTAPEKLISTLGELLNLEWIYKSVGSKAEKTTYAPPPLAELEKLKDLAQLGKMKRIVEWADSQLSNNSEYRDFALHIRELAKGVEDERIITLIGHYLDEM